MGSGTIAGETRKALVDTTGKAQGATMLCTKDVMRHHGMRIFSPHQLPTSERTRASVGYSKPETQFNEVPSKAIVRDILPAKLTYCPWKKGEGL